MSSDVVLKIETDDRQQRVNYPGKNMWATDSQKSESRLKTEV